jgi:hypothetical protein
MTVAFPGTFYVLMCLPLNHVSFSSQLGLDGQTQIASEGRLGA